MNSITLTGRLTADPETHTTRSASSLSQFRLAAGRRRGKGGEDRGAVYVDVVCFGALAESSRRAARSASRDASSSTSGRPTPASAALATKVIADEVKFLGGRREGREGEEDR